MAKEGIGHATKFLADNQSILSGLGNAAEVLGNFVPGAGLIGKTLNFAAKGFNTAANIGQGVSEDKQRQQQEEKQKIENETYKVYMDKMKNQLEQPITNQTLTAYGNILPLKHSAIDKINYKYNPFQIKPTVFKNEKEFEEKVRKNKTKHKTKSGKNKKK